MAGRRGPSRAGGWQPPAEWLLEYRGGLPALFRACEARQKTGVG